MGNLLAHNHPKRIQYLYVHVFKYYMSAHFRIPRKHWRLYSLTTHPMFNLSHPQTFLTFLFRCFPPQLWFLHLNVQPVRGTQKVIINYPLFYTVMSHYPLNVVQLPHPSWMILCTKYLSHANEQYSPKIFLITKSHSCLESHVKWQRKARMSQKKKNPVFHFRFHNFTR